MKRSWIRRKHKSSLTDANGQVVKIGNDPRLTGHRRHECAGGCKPEGKPRWHHSIQEAMYCNKLLVLKKAGHIRDYLGQVAYPLLDPRRIYHKTMRVDFQVINNQGYIEIHEYKGFATEEYQLRRIIFHHCYPGIPYYEKTEKDLMR